MNERHDRIERRSGVQGPAGGMVQQALRSRHLMGFAAGDLAQLQLVAAGRYTIASGALTSVWRSGSVAVPVLTSTGVVTLTVGGITGEASAEIACIFSCETSAITSSIAYATVGNTATVVVTSVGAGGSTPTNANGSYYVYAPLPGFASP